MDAWVPRKNILEKYRGKPATLDTAIRTLIERRIIIPRKGSRGVYKLEHKGFALWILLHTEPLENIQEKRGKMV